MDVITPLQLYLKLDESVNNVYFDYADKYPSTFRHTASDTLIRWELPVYFHTGSAQADLCTGYH